MPGHARQCQRARNDDRAGRGHRRQMDVVDLAQARERAAGGEIERERVAVRRAPHGRAKAPQRPAFRASACSRSRHRRCRRGGARPARAPRPEAPGARAMARPSCSSALMSGPRGKTTAHRCRGRCTAIIADTMAWSRPSAHAYPQAVDVAGLEGVGAFGRDQRLLLERQPDGMAEGVRGDRMRRQGWIASVMARATSPQRRPDRIISIADRSTSPARAAHGSGADARTAKPSAQ